MARIIILEGPDGSGKTTLANELQRRGYAYVHVGKPQAKENLLLTYATILYDAHKSGNNTVIDRLHLGERVYGPVMRGQDLLGEEGLTLLNRIITGYGVTTVICLPPYETALANWKSRLDREYIQDEVRYRLIYETYKRLSSSTCTWDYTQIGTSAFHAADVLEQFDAHRHCPEHVVGDPGARFLIVGEKANQETLDLPWISTGGSSHYLFECLQLAGFQEREMAFMNATRLDGSRNNVEKTWEGLSQPNVILLGAVAQDSFMVPHVKVSCLPHPAYWKRFHYDQQSEYVKLLHTARINGYR